MRLLRRCVIQLIISGPRLVSRSSQTSAKLYVMPERKPFQRLPESVKPSNYAIRIQPDLAALTFTGSEDITVSVREKTDEIVINSLELDISKAYFTRDSGEKLAADVKTDDKDETLRLKFPSILKPGDGRLSLSFSGKLSESMKGFYSSRYDGAGGESRYAAITQFEPTDARRAFPCWDEPALKATFDITLVVPKDRVALSNMPVTSEAPLESDPDKKVLTYSRTPIMSTYLLAFIVGEFDYVEGTDSDGVKHRVYTPLGKKEQGRFALDVSVKTLPFYKDFFDIAYPLPKIDLIAVADFAMGAMENWGLVTYRENVLLFDSENSSLRTKQRVALVIGHELAHQWFGNLVTMEWWTHLWLNEGFASWIEYLCVDYCFPEFEIWTQFLSTDYARALVDDALDNSHPIEVVVGHPSEIDEIFDAVSYSKGASVIRMLHHYVGEECFKKGLAQYLKKFQHKNTCTEDLWSSLEEASCKPVEAIMTTWTSKMGYPLITVSQKQDGKKRVLSLSQKKFCAGGEKKDDTSQWKVPVSVSTGSSAGKAVKTILLDSPASEMTLENVKADDWIKVNPGCVDFYRVSYSADMLDSLIPALKDMQLSPQDRLGLQNDLFALSMAGDTPADGVLKMLEAYRNEENFTVWSDIGSNLGSLANIIQYTDFYDGYTAFVTRLYGNIAAKLGWDEKPDESPLDSMLRGTVLAKMGYHGDKATIAEARRRFADHYSGKKSIPGNIRAAVYVTVVAHGDEAVYNKIHELLEKCDLQEERSRLQVSLGATKHDALIKKTLEYALSDKVRKQDLMTVMAGATRTPEARELVWRFIVENWDEMYKRFSGGFLISRLVKYGTENFATEEKAVEVEKFFEDHEAASATRTIQQSCENIRLNKNWLERDGDKLRKFLTR